MMRGIYCSNTSLNALQQKIDANANNIANSVTDGFKEGRLGIRTFKQEVDGIAAGQLQIDFTQGTLRETGDPHNFAIVGDAFFKIDSGEDTQYTRQGTFQSDAEGFLITSQGHKVAGVKGNVKLIDGKPDQPLALVSFTRKEYLVPVEGGFIADARCGIGEAGEAVVKQGFLEASSVDLARNLVDLISVSRAYAINSRMITTQDELLKKAAEEIGALKK